MSNNWIPSVPQFQRGERLSAEKLNDLAEAVAQLVWRKQQSANAAFGVRPPLEIIGKLDEDLPAATTFGTTYGEAVMSVWHKNSAGNLVDTGRNETIRQRFTDVPDLRAGDEVRARWIEGEWQVARTIGSGGHHIWFTIDSVVCNDDLSKTLYVTATWYTGGCTAAIPGEDDYSQIRVEDPCSILEFYTADWLESGGIVGRATYMYPRGAEYCEAEWLLDQICGVPECA